MPVVTRLPHRLGIILPSRDWQGRRLSVSIRKAVHRRVSDWFSRTFSGSTEDRFQLRSRLRGRWSSEKGVTVEQVDEIWAYCTTGALRKHRSDLVALAEWVAIEGDQEAVAILIDTGIELVVRKETS